MLVRVLHICSYYASPLYRLLFDALAQQGVEQEVFYFAVQGTEYDEQESDVCFSTCYSDFERLFFIHKERKAVDALYRNIDVASFDIVHAHSLFTNGFLALEAKRRFGIPYIVAVRNTDVNSFFRIRPWLRRVGIEIMQEASRVIFLSPAYKKRIIEKIVPKREENEIEKNSIIIPNGINEVFHDNPPSGPRERDGVIRVVQVGDINRNKNQIAVVRACHYLIRRGKKVSYTVVGRERNARVAAKLASYPFVKLFPPMSQRDLISIYRNSDVFVMPSIHETFGLSYVEAMSQGLPVIFTKGQGFDGWICDNRIGVGVNPRRWRDISEAITELFMNKEDAFGPLLVSSKKFHWSKIAQRYIDIYKKGTDLNLIGGK